MMSMGQQVESLLPPPRRIPSVSSMPPKLTYINCSWLCENAPMGEFAIGTPIAPTSQTQQRRYSINGTPAWERACA
jgi:hypothetical protein